MPRPLDVVVMSDGPLSVHGRRFVERLASPSRAEVKLLGLVTYQGRTLQRLWRATGGGTRSPIRRLLAKGRQHIHDLLVPRHSPPLPGLLDIEAAAAKLAQLGLWLGEGPAPDLSSGGAPSLGVLTVSWGDDPSANRLVVQVEGTRPAALLESRHKTLPDLGETGSLGPVVARRTVDVEAFDTLASKRIKADIASMLLLEEVLDAVLDDRVEPVARKPPPHSPRELPRYSRRIFRRRRVDPYAGAFDRLVASAARGIRSALTMLLLPYLAHLRSQREARGQAPIVIFCFHGVGNGGDNWMTIPIDEFSAQITYLREHFAIISLEAAVARLRGGKNEQTSAVLTFDDGYASCYNNAREYLSYYGVPATVFVCPETSSQGKQFHHDAAVGCDAAVMTPEQIRHMAQSGWEVGSHGNHHEDLGGHHGGELEQGLLGSAAGVERITGVVPRYFAYPFGEKQNMSAQAMTVARRQYDAVFSAYGGYNTAGERDTFHFQRIGNAANLGSLIAIMNGLHRLSPFYVDRPPELS